MRATDLRLWFIGLTVAVLLGTSFQNAKLMRADYDDLAQSYAREIAHIDAVSARTQSPRIIFAGGSSVIYAIDAKLIERELGIRVVNMAISDRIGSDANYFDYLLPRIRKGDLVIYSNHSWWVKSTREAEAGETRESRRLADRLWQLAQIDLAERQYVDWPLLSPVPDISLINRLRSRRQADPVFSVRKRDDHGGLVQCPTRTVSFKPHDAPLARPDGKVIAHSRQFVRDAESRGARVILFETPILIAAREREKWSRYRQELRSQLAPVAPVLDAPDSSVFSADASRFCDSASHIDDAVRVEWSRYLSAQLRQFSTEWVLERQMLR